MSQRGELKAQPTDTLQPRVSGLLQRKCDCGQHTLAGGQCDGCQSKSVGTLQRAATNRDSGAAIPSIVYDVLRSNGQPLDVGAREFMESRFGHDFSRVRVHSDARASESAQSVNALAYTVGRDVVFGAGQYAPHSTSGRRLLAHELTHVAQQERTPYATPERFAIGPSDSVAESEAESIARRVTSGHEDLNVSGSSMQESLQRQPATHTGDEQKNAKEEKKVVTQPPAQKVPAEKVKEVEKKEAKDEKKDIEHNLTVGVETETKKEDGKTKTEVAGKFNIEATIPFIDKRFGPLSFAKEFSGSLGGKLNLSELEGELALKVISLDFEKVKVPLGLVDIGLSGSAITSVGHDFREKKETAKFGFGAGAEVKYKRSETSPFFIKVEGGLEKTYDQDGDANFKWGPLTWKTSASVGFDF